MTEAPALSNSNCPCGSLLCLRTCRCAEIIRGTGNADTAAQLLRARYTAFVTHNLDFITASTHPSMRSESFDAANRKWSEQSVFHGLHVLDSKLDDGNDDIAFVTFEVPFTRRGERQVHRERARFERENGVWFFVSNEMLKPTTVRHANPAVGRNAPCPCGSKAKYKRCCGK